MSNYLDKLRRGSGLDSYGNAYQFPYEVKAVAEIERLTAEKSEAIQAFAAEVRKNVALQARVDALEGEVGEWREIGRSTLDQLDHECDSVIFIPKSHEDAMRRLIAATEQDGGCADGHDFRPFRGSAKCHDCGEMADCTETGAMKATEQEGET